jgi:hypothetical protein
MLYSNVITRHIGLTQTSFHTFAKSENLTTF